MGSDRTHRMVRRPSCKSDHAQRMDTAIEDTAREGRRGKRDRQTRSIQRKAEGTRRTQQESVIKALRKSDKDSTKKERGMEWKSDSDWAPNQGTYARQVSDPRKGRTLERALNSRRLAAAVRTTRKRAASDRAQREASGRGTKPIRKDLGLTTNDNLRS